MAPSILYTKANLTPEPDFINHENSDHLDSSNAFEGPEKLLEVWFANCPGQLEGKSLRYIPVQEIENLLDLVNCKILSKISGPEVDSYLLSESSLFVFPHKVILKTCGTTTTLLCLSKLFELAEKYIGWDSHVPYRVFYSRRSFMFPHKQNHIHKCWNNELQYLNQHFDESTSKSYIVGDLSKDHWYLYMNGTGEMAYPLTPSHSSTESVVSVSDSLDETLELLMTDLDSKKCGAFTYDAESCNVPDFGHIMGRKTMESTSLANLFHDSSVKHDSFSFTPCGFSSNSILGKDFYYTFHVTPENGWSYASFETNAPGDKAELVHKVLDVFRPGKFCLVLVKESESHNDDLRKLSTLQIDGYDRVDKIVYDIKFGYKLLYSYFEKVN